MTGQTLEEFGVQIINAYDDEFKELLHEEFKKLKTKFQ